jgi:hypothetical protein
MQLKQKEASEHRLLVDQFGKKILCSCEDGIVRNYVTGRKMKDFEIIKFIDPQAKQIING